MAFLVEDGNGLPDSNAYDSVANFKTHHTDRGTFVTNDYSDAEIQVGLINASDYIDKRFGRRFRGYRKSATQAMEWPRLDAYTDDDFMLSGVPKALKMATNEYAWVALKLARNLAPIPGNEFAIINPETGEVVSDASGMVTAKTETVGPITESTSYESRSSSHPMTSTGNLIERIPEYPQADLWIEELLMSRSSGQVFRG